MNTIFVHRDGRTESATSIDRSWLGPPPAGKPLYLWVDLAAPSIPESLVLTDSFAFHPLAVEAARAERQLPAIDAFDGYLFAVVAGADADISVFVGPHYIVSVHRAESKAIADQIDSVRHGGRQFSEGPFAMFHRLVDATVDGLAQVVQAQRSGADGLEKRTNRHLELFVRLLEPIMLLVMAGAVLPVVAGFLLPVFMMSQAVG